jgi:hypothetical protein
MSTRPATYRYERYKELRVAWTSDLDGGGRGFGQQVVPAVQKLVGKVGRVYEFCAGPGFMGFSLLAHGLCESLCLSDINPLAVAAVRETIALNGLEDRVSVYLSDALDAIPEHERWDLVVSNPPHFRRPQDDSWSLLSNDPDWNIHKRFYARVRRHLTSNGRCFIQENYEGSRESVFLPFLHGSGLEYVGSFMLTQHLHAAAEINPLNSFYFFVTRPSHDDVVWADASSAMDVDVVLDASGWIISAETRTATATALRLPIGRKYRLALSNTRVQEAVFTISSESRSLTVKMGAESALPDRHVFIPTAPARIVDAATGRVIVAFE